MSTIIVYKNIHVKLVSTKILQHFQLAISESNEVFESFVLISDKRKANIRSVIMLALILQEKCI